MGALAPVKGTPPPSWLIADNKLKCFDVLLLFIIASPPSASWLFPMFTPPKACEGPLITPPFSNFWLAMIADCVAACMPNGIKAAKP